MNFETGRDLVVSGDVFDDGLTAGARPLLQGTDGGGDHVVVGRVSGRFPRDLRLIGLGCWRHRFFFFLESFLRSFFGKELLRLTNASVIARGANL